VLGCVVSEALYRAAPALTEGKLSRMRAELIRQESLAAIAREMGLSAHLRLDESAAMNGGASRPSILSNALEAIFGAALLDGGYDAARRVIEHSFGAALARPDDAALQKDPKSRLQEYLHAKKLQLPQYRIVSTSGPKQSQTFEVECLVEDLQTRASGSGGTRRHAEQEAAGRVLKLLGA
jgi:ribonuclease-3